MGEREIRRDFPGRVNQKVAGREMGKVCLQFVLVERGGQQSPHFVRQLVALGFFGALDRSSKKTYPALGLTLNIGILALFAVLLVIGLAMKGH